LIDVGVDCLETFPNVTHSKVLATGTRNFAKEKAMTLEEVQKALQVGKDAIKKADEEGIKVTLKNKMKKKNFFFFFFFFFVVFCLPSKTNKIDFSFFLSFFLTFFLSFLSFFSFLFFSFSF
jgi:hypothetical protein